MSTSFSGLGAALSSLIAQQRGLDVTGQNIANANTDGYSRQEVDLQSVGASTVPALWSTYQSAGQGVDVAGVQRIADTLLIGRSQAEHGQLATLSGSKTTMDTIETSFGEPSDTGLQTTLANFWASWHDVANDPSSNASRSVLLNQAQAVVDGVSKVSSALNDQWLATKGQLADTVQTVNNTISAVAQLNGTIMRNTASGIPSNELMDQRDQLVLQLADAVGATSKPQPDGSLSVFVSGTAVVSGPTARSLQITGGSSLANVPTDPAVLTWNGAGYPASIPAGQVGAMTAALNTTIPKYMAGIDGVATSLVSTVNAVHAAGYDAAGLPGGPFFSGTSAATLGVAITDPTKIAASGVALPVPNLDGSNATAMADLASASGGADAGYRQLVSTLGAETASAGQRVAVQQATTASVDGARAAQSGVNLDEEMVNLMKYQHAYEGASRVINSVDSMLDTLINRTGLVGR